MTATTPKPRVLVPFVCPACAGANEVHLITLSVAGGMPCASCSKWLKVADVMRAMHSPRPAGAAPMRLEDAEPVGTRVATRGGTRPASSRPRDAVVWPPTAETRAAAAKADAKARRR